MQNIDNLIEEKHNPSDNLYLTPGTHAQVIGSQNGGFPAFGHHLPNEMGGVWAHPIKLLDGFWLGIKINDQPFQQLLEATTFRNCGFYTEHVYQLPLLKITRLQFVPENHPGLIVQYFFENISDSPLTIRGELLARSDISPVWFSDKGGFFAGKDEGWLEDEENKYVIIKDNDNSWFTNLCLEGSNNASAINLRQPEVSDEIMGYEVTYGNGTGVRWPFTIALPTQALSAKLSSQSTYDSKKTKSINHALIFRVTGSIISKDDTIDVMEKLNNVWDLFEKKKKRYQEILDTASIEIPDHNLINQYQWAKLHTEWLTTNVPGVGNGLTAGSPEYPWWFGCDNSYALMGCVPVGFHVLAENTLDTLRDLSYRVNGNGRIIHEANTFGVVVNHGNTQETAHFICAVYNTYKWTGNIEWLRRHYDGIKLGLKWLFEEMDTDGDLFPEGYGIMEVSGLNGELIDVATYSAVALAYVSEMAILFDEPKLAKEYDDLGKKLKSKIISEMWLDDMDLFADLRTSGKELYARLDDFIDQVVKYDDGSNAHLIPYYDEVKADILANGLEKDSIDRPWCFKNWVIATPIEMNLVKREIALRSLKRLNSEEFTGEYGMFLSGLEQTRIMTISAGVLANANLRYEQADMALKQIKGTMKTFGRYLVGSHSEMSPDYGCFVQAWTSYVILSPIITGFIGVIPDAAKQLVTFKPQLPKDWDYAKVKMLKVGSNEIDVEVERDNANVYKYRDSCSHEVKYTVKVTSKEKDWLFYGYDNSIRIVCT